MARTNYVWVITMKSGTTRILDNTAKLLAGVELLTSRRVMVGVPEDKSSREGEITNAALAYIHDKGAPEAKIPARPFMEPGVRRASNQTVALMRRAGELALDLRPSAVENQLMKVGLVNQAAIRGVITEGIPPPLAESTVKSRIYRVKGKKRRERLKGLLASGAAASRQAGYEEYGAGLFTPLVVTGQLRNAITYVIRRISGAKRKPAP